ncbi:hypothetical protein AVO45_16300 [Ruegeria marisrubri]|uniref:Response regulatory domain-containing protein n=1 Tax=Ruegeria marisrubri TaxID=1685379 RepID=A0A0X3UB29_9RHOB|nr:response regulator [Ruegeria marisrubri]KUJ85315.1 hypothetical protein AVO45_16300 [Ruegeria marisrubri]
MRILAVDDDLSILELLTHILTAFGYEDVVTAKSGREALRILSETTEAFDCLLLDVQMPQMNGITLCEEARKLPDYRFTPIIMVTAMVQKQYIDEAFEVGATDYVTKPFEFDDLKQRLSDAYRLAAERKAAIEALEACEHASNVTKVKPDFHLSDPLHFSDLAGCFGLSEFENYVVQIATTHPLNSKIVAVKVTNAEQIFNFSTPDEFRKIMASAGDALLSATQETRNFATYWGNGVFLLALDNDEEQSDHWLAQKLSDISAEGAIDALPNTKLTYRVGEEISLQAASKLDAIFTINKAVEQVEWPSWQREVG